MPGLVLLAISPPPPTVATRAEIPPTNNAAATIPAAMTVTIEESTDFPLVKSD